MSASPRHPLALERLLDGHPVDAPPEAGRVLVSGVAIDSRQVEPGDLFLAVPGEHRDGREFAADAVARGAVAVLAAPGPEPEGLAVPWLTTAEPRALATPLALRLHGHPDRELLCAAVTGTNGKSTVAALLASIFTAAGRPAGLVGTLGYGFGDEREAGERTTPEGPRLARLLGRWRDAGAAAVAIEASSHALALHRLDGFAFDVAVFTNLTRDHLDWHDGFEDYFRAKRHLFDLLAEDGRAAVNLDDPWGRRLATEMGPRAITWGTGLFGDDDAGWQADVALEDAHLDLDGIRATVETPRGRLELASPLIGRFNLVNLLGAVAAVEALAARPDDARPDDDGPIDHDAVIRGIAACGVLAGRLERMETPSVLPFPVFVDYAHTPGALEAMLSSLAEIKDPDGRILLVFGAGGDRDRGKREPMGEVAGRLADLPILTSDNPRSEDPLAILRSVEAGVRSAGNRSYRVVPDRREAIRRAIAVAGPGDVVVVAGKGHEETQEIGGETRPFSDRNEIETAVEERLGQPANG